MRASARTIKYFQRRNDTESQEKEKREGDGMKTKDCVECGAHVPEYLNFYCEACWKKAWNEKLKEND